MLRAVSVRHRYVASSQMLHGDARAVSAAESLPQVSPYLPGHVSTIFHIPHCQRQHSVSCGPPCVGHSHQLHAIHNTSLSSISLAHSVRACLAHACTPELVSANLSGHAWMSGLICGVHRWPSILLAARGWLLHGPRTVQAYLLSRHLAR